MSPALSLAAQSAPTGWFAAVLWILMSILALAIGVSGFRIIRGPTLPDRVVGLDLMGTVIVGFVAVYAIISNQPILLHVSIGVALMLFVGTVAFALYLEKGAGR